MSGKELHALNVLQLSAISTKIDRYHKLVRDGFTDELRRTIRALQVERKETNDKYDRCIAERTDTVGKLQQVILQLEKSNSTLQIQWSCLNDLYIETKQRVAHLDLANVALVNRAQQVSDDYKSLKVQTKTLTDVGEQLSTRTQELHMSQSACIELRAQVKTMSLQAKAYEDMERRNMNVTSNNIELLAENTRLQTENVHIPQLQETARWFHHFLPSIDVTTLTSVPKVRHAQEVATHRLLQSMFGDQFHSIEVVSNRGHRGDIHIQPEKGGPSVLVEVKTYLPSSKGTMRNGHRMHEVPSKMGRQKLIDDLGQSRP